MPPVPDRARLALQREQVRQLVAASRELRASCAAQQLRARVALTRAHDILSRSTRRQNRAI